MLDLFQFIEQGGVTSLGQAQAEVMVAVQQLAHAPQAAGHHVEDTTVQTPGYLLAQARDAQVLGTFQGAAVRLDLAGDDLHQGGLAGAVAAHQAQPLPGLDLELDLVQEQGAAVAEADVAQAQECHGNSAVGESKEGRV